ncbi:MAG: hypothetical protein K2I37_04630 [Muribaculaceae bacterium]|nr:hypothetical protein [Muribaculaceae bacterium]
MKGLNDQTSEEKHDVGNSFVDVILLIVFWSTISPLMLAVNRNEKYMKKWVMWLLIVFSPTTLNILTLLILPGSVMDVFINMIQKWGYAVNTEMSPVLQQFGHSKLVLFLQSMFLPVYAVCVAVLLVAMGVTGWNYNEASVYICEYFEPLSCAAVALVIALIILCKLPKMNVRGRIISMIPLAVELFMIRQNVNIYFERKATYAGMSINEIFRYVVDYLLTMARDTDTNYVLANMYVYILPMLIILIVGYIARIIYNRNRKVKTAPRVVASTEPS